ncbi:MAG: thiol oxidoreductase [Candidatus Solibacter usitatus]|nr:thiol oxidoreductase [Candidatus Solibacter usitatus]
MRMGMLAATVVCVFAQVDPGVRGGPAGAGGPLPGLTTAELAAFNRGKLAFEEADGVDEGLGPRFNLDQCSGCHMQPAVGGTSPAVNPQVAMATKNGALNVLPPFISLSGPVREVRFKFRPDGSRDGGVADLFTIRGRSDAPGCNLAQPDFSNAANHAFRIPTPAFGAGLIEAIPDSAIRANLASNALLKGALGIRGRVNTNGNDGTVTRFVWKAQNKSLLLFSAEAYNVEQGVTNEIFQTERDETPGCAVNGTPESHTDFATGDPGDVVRFATFMRFLNPPAPAPPSPSTINGRNLFLLTGCALCHTPSLKTGQSSTAALSHKTANLYSDLALHNMGNSLADNIVQGVAGPDEFRTAPLWGVGQRIFFLHDGRTTNLAAAIAAHAGPGSEANLVIAAFQTLPPAARQDVLNFLRWL